MNSMTMEESLIRLYDIGRLRADEEDDDQEDEAEEDNDEDDGKIVTSQRLPKRLQLFDKIK